MHGDGVGAPTPELVEKRAREIALIDERDPDEFTDADWEQARREMLGTASEIAPEELEDQPGLPDEHDLIGGTPGHHAHRAGENDEATLGEQLVSEGREEAAHDQMLEARREELNRENS